MSATARKCASLLAGTFESVASMKKADREKFWDGQKPIDLSTVTKFLEDVISKKKE